jgi:ABC-type sugar transport system permease subunit
MLLPAVLLFVGVQVAPMIYSAGLSFFRWDGLSDPRFVGWKNFRSFLIDDTLLRHLFYQSLWNNLKLAVFVTLGVVLVSLVLAWAMSRAPRRITGIFRTTLLFPMVTTGIAVFFAWTALLGPGGPVVSLFDSLHIGFLAPYNGWFGDPRLSIVGVIVVAIWSNVPYATLFYLSGMQSIDETLYEAAELDGANRFQQARMITIPLLNPVTAIVVVLNIVAAMQSYEMVYLMTNGGPNFTTNTVGLLSYNLAFGTIGATAPQFGTSAAMTWTLVAALAIGFGSFRLMRGVLSRVFA